MVATRRFAPRDLSTLPVDIRGNLHGRHATLRSPRLVDTSGRHPRKPTWSLRDPERFQTALEENGAERSDHVDKLGTSGGSPDK